jgi:CheY-like chemotaxis protein
MVVDHLKDIGRVVRATLDLLNQPAIVVEVPAGEEAILELQRTNYTALVSAFALAGMNGLEVCQRALIDAPELHPIVLANPYDELPDEEAPFTVLVKPHAAADFVRALRLALGEQVEEEAGEAAPGPSVDLGPVPAINLEDIRSTLSAVLTDVGAMAAVFIDRTGEVLLEQGAVGYLDREKLAVTLAPQFAAMTHIGEVVGGQAWGMHFWDGKEFDIYGLSVGLHHFVCLVFEGTTGNRALGAVSMYGRRAVEEMVKSFGPLAWEVKKQEKPAAKPKRRAERPAAPPPKPEPEAAAPEPAPPPKPKPKKEKAPPPPPPEIEVDDATLKEALSKTESVDVDAFWETLGSGGDELTGDAVANEDALSFEEALQLGLLPPELSDKGS